MPWVARSRAGNSFPLGGGLPEGALFWGCLGQFLQASVGEGPCAGAFLPRWNPSVNLELGVSTVWAPAAAPLPGRADLEIHPDTRLPG